MARGKKKTSLYNPNTTPVVYDESGHIVAGGERVEVDEVDEYGQEAVDGGLLVLEGDEDDPDEHAVPVKQAVTARASGASPAEKAP